jgi:uncharacterized ferritin-like protein (DUF455 family)
VDEARTGAISPKTIDEIAERFLASDRVEEKLELTAFSAGLADSISSVVGERRALPEPISFVRFPERPERVDPRDLPRRKLTSIEGRRALLHAVAHIEFTAIHLAWDLLYRFRGLPDRFYLDWLGVAREEASHFELIRARLRELGCDYGDLPSHGGLWEVAEDTDYDVAARLALVPRCMEARGLDVTPGMISRLEQIGDSASAAVLRVILRDEVGHVALGTHWFRWVCAERRLEPDSEYLALVRRHLRGEQRGPFNRALRRQAGFSEAELSRLEEPFGG